MQFSFATRAYCIWTQRNITCLSIACMHAFVCELHSFSILCECTWHFLLLEHARSFSFSCALLKRSCMCAHVFNNLRRVLSFSRTLLAAGNCHYFDNSCPRFHACGAEYLFHTKHLCMHRILLHPDTFKRCLICTPITTDHCFHRMPPDHDLLHAYGAVCSSRTIYSCSEFYCIQTCANNVFITYVITWDIVFCYPLVQIFMLWWWFCSHHPSTQVCTEF
jgi:hypothetical protein